MRGTSNKADLATERERHMTTGKRAKTTKLDFRCSICRSAIGQTSCLICACRRQLTFPPCCQISLVRCPQSEVNPEIGKILQKTAGAKTLKFSDLSLAFSSGIPIAISRSKRPARRRAGSSESGLLVAPITSTWASGLLFRSEKKIRKEPYKPLPHCHEKAPTRSLAWQNLMEYGRFATKSSRYKSFGRIMMSIRCKVLKSFR